MLDAVPASRSPLYHSSAVLQTSIRGWLASLDANADERITWEAGHPSAREIGAVAQQEKVPVTPTPIKLPTSPILQMADNVNRRCDALHTPGLTA